MFAVPVLAIRLVHMHGHVSGMNSSPLLRAGSSMSAGSTLHHYWCAPCTHIGNLQGHGISGDALISIQVCISAKGVGPWIGMSLMQLSAPPVARTGDHWCLHQVHRRYCHCTPLLTLPAGNPRPPIQPWWSWSIRAWHVSCLAEQ